MSIYSLEFKKKYPEINLSEYFQFIEEHRLPNKVKFETSTHHILPRWAFPEFKNLTHFNWNVVILSHKNHLLAHMLLAKCWNVHENTSCVLRLTDGRTDISALDSHWFSLYESTIKQNNINISIRNKG